MNEELFSSAFCLPLFFRRLASRIFPVTDDLPHELLFHEVFRIGLGAAFAKFRATPPRNSFPLFRSAVSAVDFTFPQQVLPAPPEYSGPSFKLPPPPLPIASSFTFLPPLRFHRPPTSRLLAICQCKDFHFFSNELLETESERGEGSAFFQ